MTKSGGDWHDPTDWVIANYPWRHGSSSGGAQTETPGRPASLLRLRPEDLGLGPASPPSRQPSSPPARCDRRTDEETLQDDDDENLLHHHHHQQQQQEELGNHDNDLVIDPLVYNLLVQLSSSTKTSRLGEVNSRRYFSPVQNQSQDRIFRDNKRC